MGYYDHMNNNGASGCANWLLAGIIIFLGVLIACGFGLLFAFPEMWLWNWLVPTLFNGPEITYWQMVGLHVLCALLIKSSSTTSTNNQ